MRTLQYTLTQGKPWERLIMVKDRRTRRPRRISDTGLRSVMRHSSTMETVEVDVSVSFEGGASLCLTATTTANMTPGVWDFDVVGDFRGQLEKLASGTVDVEASSSITPMDGVSVLTINYDQYTDYRRVFSWQDEDGEVLEVSDARMQVRDSDNAVIMDISFFATPPDETAIGALDPDKRGYLSPITGASLELHVSDQATVAVGSYSYDIFVKGAVSGDWAKLAAGAFVVQDSVSEPA